MNYRPVEVVEVRAWGRSVGALARGDAGAYVFEYLPEWGRAGIELSPLLMPAVPRRRYAFPALSKGTWHGLPPLLADSLPDDFGNALIDAWMAREGVERARVTALDRLAYLGARGMGALEFVPDVGPGTRRPSAIDMSSLVVAARAAVSGTLLSDAEASSALQQIINVGTSAGGARAKAVLNVNDATGEIRSGQLPAPPGFGAWLLKFDGVGLDRQLGQSQAYGRIEYAYSLMAAAAGLSMPETRLLTEGGRAHFMAKRFDRTADGGKMHMQTLCALAAIDFRLRGVNDYVQYLQAIDELNLGASAREQAFRRLVFNVAARNCDDHAKNFAFLLPADGAWELAPAYDVTFAYNPQGEWTYQHLMGVDGKFADLTRADLLNFADRRGILAAGSIIDEVIDAIDSWAQFAAQADLAPEHRDEVASQFPLAALRRRARAPKP
ncbi:MAG: type II toxin-antitoxin system HipA family toxin [Promicromonosporaceae bacterium]|nr:type II toxin-antitoxin system HipA family toxin [Promicromonosporaceae bacterium]